ncbi:hypothetical protein ACIBJF_49925 [Streptomyces sp. NPDC050743]|uniref:hypothetical protein n=1 Tax=Streptomyces sp. NPDC050743 TaxID=3365634 RepID=UPI0037A6E686
MDTTLAGGPERVRAAETAEVDDGPDRVVDAGSACLLQGRRPDLARVLVGRRGRADRDVEFAATAVAREQARSPLPQGQVDHAPAVPSQHLRNGHRQTSVIKPGELIGGVVAVWIELGRRLIAASPGGSALRCCDRCPVCGRCRC